MTLRQSHYLQALARLTAKHGFPPSLRELMEALSVRSSNSVAEMVARLEAEGWVSRSAAKARTLSITPEGRKAMVER